MNVTTPSSRKAATPRVLSVLAIAACLVAGSAYAQSTPTYNPYAGTVIVKKFYDANANGIRDTGEPWLTDWPMTLTGNGVDSTLNSTATFLNLDPGGGYWVQEGTPIETNWVQTAPRVNGVPVNPKSVTVVSCQTVTIKFGNYCKKPSGGKTPGFWSNQNGEAKLNDGGTMAPELGLLASLNLVDAAGNPFDPTNYGSFRSWLLASDAVNMAYKLSSHLAAMTLNVEAGFVNGDSTFLPCHCTINELLDDANASLGAFPYTPTGHPQRANQEQLKNWLDQLNNGALVVSPTPCKRTFESTY
jgi:hypothetical protein